MDNITEYHGWIDYQVNPEPVSMDDLSTKELEEYNQWSEKLDEQFKEQFND